MADWPSGLVLLTVVPLMALVFCGCALSSATLLLRIRNGGAKFALPFLIYALTLAILVYAPLHKIALQQNFDWHRDDRERIVARVEAGELKPNVSTNKSLIALGDRAPNVSAGGNDIVVDETDEGTFVLFLTSRGLKHYFTGFLRVPPDGDPKKFFEFDDKPLSQLDRRVEMVDRDTLVDPSGGQRTADAIPGARFELIDGMGHDLPLALVEQIADAIAEHAK